MPSFTISGVPLTIYAVPLTIYEALLPTCRRSDSDPMTILACSNQLMKLLRSALNPTIAKRVER